MADCVELEPHEIRNATRHTSHRHHCCPPGTGVGFGALVLTLVLLPALAGMPGSNGNAAAAEPLASWLGLGIGGAFGRRSRTSQVAGR